MKCTWIIHTKTCGKETGKECPPRWWKHQNFSAFVLYLFFSGTEYDKHLDELEAFCCPEHREMYMKRLRNGRKMSASKKPKEPEYYI